MNIVSISMRAGYYFFIILPFLYPVETFARAGGGGGGKGGGIVTLILLPFFVIYSLIISWLVNKKHRQSKALLEKLSMKSSEWDLGTLKSRFEKIYFKVQEAWMLRNQDIARGFMSPRLYEKHKLQTDQMIRQRRVNILENVNLESAKIIEVADYKDDSKDKIHVYISGSMIDYIRDEDTYQVISGKIDEPENFTEIWKFVRDKDSNWVLDEIINGAGIADLYDLKSFSEELDQ